jgi:hypothetical protein
MTYKADVKQWRLEWYEDGKKKTKSFSETKWGAEAKRLIEVFRRSVYPQYESEETALADLAGIEL